MEQHYRLTLKDAIAKHSAGDLTAKGLLHFYILIKCGGRAKDWKFRLEQPKVSKELGLSKAAFYSAVSRLREEGSISWEAPKGILVSISAPVCERGQESTILDSESTILDSESTILDSESTILDSESTILDSESTIVDFEPPEPPPDKDSSDSPYLLTDSYQIFLSSLSDGERANFLSFGLEKAKNLPSPPELPAKWLRKNWQEIAEQWRRSHVGAPPSHDWENDPRRDEWLGKIREIGYVAFAFELGECDPDRMAFFRWANENKLIWED